MAQELRSETVEAPCLCRVSINITRSFDHLRFRQVSLGCCNFYLSFVLSFAVFASLQWELSLGIGVAGLRRGNNMQALRQRNAEYIGVKVAMAILCLSRRVNGG